MFTEECLLDLTMAWNEKTGCGLPMESHVTILLGSYSIMLLFALMVRLCMALNILQNPKMLYQGIGHMT